MKKHTQITLDDKDIFEAIKVFLSNKYDIPYDSICNYVWSGKTSESMIINLSEVKLERKDAV